MLNLIIFYLVSIMIAGLLSAGLYKTKPGKYLAPAIYAGFSLSLLVLIIVKFRYFQSGIIRCRWAMPLANLELGADHLSLFFMIPLLILTTATSVYGSRYFKNGPPSKFHWLNYGLLVSGMMLVLLSRNAIIFMLSWELMSFSSFLLVISNAEEESTRRAGWIYFITAHIGTAFLLAMFFMLGAGSESFSFNLFGSIPFSVKQSNLILIFATVGFGLKAGFIPFHIWLPLAHPAAPSHVSALMSGIMIKMGIYGIMRVLTFLNPPGIFWAGVFIAIGAASGIIGVLFAIGQHDIKKLLAYHSVENIGIIMLGIGTGMLGAAVKNPLITIFGYGGALLHVVNHALFKGLLFMGAGSVIRQSGTGNLDHLGGLLKKMPMTGTLFLAASAAITGLPFFNGFISEIFIYAGAVTGAVAPGGPILPFVSALTVLSLALIGGLAAACFTKVFGIVFQGSARTSQAETTEEVPGPMKAGMLITAVFLIIIGMFSFLTVPYVGKAVQVLTSGASVTALGALSVITKKISLILPGILILITLLLLRGRQRSKSIPVRNAETWGCGYSNPDPSIQYTASSFAAPVTDSFGTIIAAEKELHGEDKFFPEKSWSFKSKTDDWFLSKVFTGIFKGIDRILSLLRWFQCGKAGIYVLYITLTVISLFIWKFVL